MIYTKHYNNFKVVINENNQKISLNFYSYAEKIGSFCHNKQTGEVKYFFRKDLNYYTRTTVNHLGHMHGSVDYILHNLSSIDFIKFNYKGYYKSVKEWRE